MKRKKKMSNVINVDFVNKNNKLREKGSGSHITKKQKKSKIIRDKTIKSFIEKLKNVEGVDQDSLKQIEENYQSYQDHLIDFDSNFDEHILYLKDNHHFDYCLHGTDNFHTRITGIFRHERFSSSWLDLRQWKPKNVFRWRNGCIDLNYFSLKSIGKSMTTVICSAITTNGKVAESSEGWRDFCKHLHGLTLINLTSSTEISW